MNADKAFEGKIFRQKLREALFPTADPVNKVIAGNPFHGGDMHIGGAAIQNHQIIHFQKERENLPANPGSAFFEIFVRRDLFVNFIQRDIPHVPGFETRYFQSRK